MYQQIKSPQQKQCYPEKICTVMMIEEVEGVQANCIIYGPRKLNCKDLDGRPYALK